MMEFDILGFVKHVAALTATVPIAEHVALEHAAEIVEREAKRVLGTYDYHWPQLAESTQEQRVHEGYSANEPGLRSGEMRTSIEHVVERHEAHVGSDDEHLVYFELGTSKQPPRSVLGQAAIRKTDHVIHETGRVIHAHLAGSNVKAIGFAVKD